MDWPPHNISPDHWSSVPFDNIASRSAAPEPHPPKSQIIDSTSFSTPLSLLAQPSYDLLDSYPLDVRHAHHDPIERNEHQHTAMRDDVGRNDLMPTGSALPCSACNGVRRPRPSRPQSGPPNTHNCPKKIDEPPISLICKWENCRKPFKSKGTLKRHVNTQHLDPHSFHCPDQSCNKPFSRKDNMKNHVRAFHPWIAFELESL